MSRRRMWGHLVREPNRPSKRSDSLNSPLSSRAGRVLHRTPSVIRREIADTQKDSEACPWCSGGCWCDGDWSPEARILTLREELAEAEKHEARGKHGRFA